MYTRGLYTYNIHVNCTCKTHMYMYMYMFLNERHVHTHCRLQNVSNIVHVPRHEGWQLVAEIPLRTRCNISLFGAAHTPSGCMHNA